MTTPIRTEIVPEEPEAPRTPPAIQFTQRPLSFAPQTPTREELLFLLRRALRFTDSCPVVTVQDHQDFNALSRRTIELGINPERVADR